jgi:hypothetical protein
MHFGNSKRIVLKIYLYSYLFTLNDIYIKWFKLKRNFHQVIKLFRCDSARYSINLFLCTFFGHARVNLIKILRFGTKMTKAIIWY